jgi:hypothetical protein
MDQQTVDGIGELIQKLEAQKKRFIRKSDAAYRCRRIHRSSTDTKFLFQCELVHRLGCPHAL